MATIQLGVSEDYVGRGRDAKPGESYQGEVAAILNAELNIVFSLQCHLIVNVFTPYVKYCAVKTSTHHVQKTPRPSPSPFAATFMFARAIVNGGGRRPGFDAT